MSTMHGIATHEDYVRRAGDAMAVWKKASQVGGHSATSREPMTVVALSRRRHKPQRRNHARPMTVTERRIAGLPPVLVSEGPPDFDPEAAEGFIARLDRIIPPGSVTGAPARGRPHSSSLRNALYGWNDEEAATA